MADTNETITDIIRKIRAEADSIEESARGSLKAGETWDGRPFTESDLEAALDLANSKRKEADRLEAAHKREMSKNTSKNGADFGQLGDCAKLREALKECANMGEQIDYQLGSSDETVYAFRNERSLAHNISECARAALAAPPKNCDVGTAEEQEERFLEFCEKALRGHCRDCCLYNASNCVFAWAQMPYEKGGAK